MVIDGDLDLTNEFVDYVPAKFQVPSIWNRAAGERPNPGNELGAPLLWLPFFFMAHALVNIVNLFGGSAIAADGYSYPYINAVCLGSLIWGFLGVLLSFRLAARYFDATLAAWSAVLLWLASPLIWYTVREPAMSHAISMMAVALFFTVWLRAHRGGGLTRWIVVAVAAGLMISIQRYNVFYLLAPALTAVHRFGALFPRERAADRARAFKTVAIIALVLVVTTSPIWLYNLYSEGQLIGHGDLPRNSLSDWRNPHIVAFLFSSNHGLFSWNPVVFLSAIGLCLLLPREKWLALTLLATLAGGIYLLSSTWNWYAGYSFGSRRMTEAYPLLLVGLCAFLDWMRRSPRLSVSLLAAGLVVWNFLLADQLRRGQIRPMGSFAFSEAAARGAERLYRGVGHLPSAPANWLFAWKYGVRPDQFDAIYGDIPNQNFCVSIGADFGLDNYRKATKEETERGCSDIRGDRSFIGKGWSEPETMPDGRTYRWSDGSASSLFVYLQRPQRYRLRLVGEPVRSDSTPAQRVTLEVNGAPAGLLTFSRNRWDAEAVIDERFWVTGLNEILIRYSHTLRGDEVYGGSDPRELGLRAESIGLRIEN